MVPRRLRHYVILGGIYADTPAQRKLSKWLGHSAYLGCGHCMLLGTVGPNGHGMYFQGYTEQRAAGICSVCSAPCLLRALSALSSALLCPAMHGLLFCALSGDSAKRLTGQQY